MFLRWKVALLSPLLTLALLVQMAPQTAQAAVTSCAAGGQVTVTTVTSEGTISLVISCTGTQLASTGRAGSSSTTLFYPGSPCNVNVVGNGAGNCQALDNAYCAGSQWAVDQTYWIPLSVRRGLNNIYKLTMYRKDGSVDNLLYPGYYPAGPSYYTATSAFNAGAVVPGSGIAAVNGLFGIPPPYNPPTAGGNSTYGSYSQQQVFEVSGDSMDRMGLGQPGGAILSGIVDSSQDALSQKNILAGPVYNRMDLHAATWVGGSSAYYTYSTNWVITGYTQQLASAGYWTNLDLATSDWAASKYTSYYWMDWFGANRPRVIATPGAGAGSPAAWPGYWQYEINGETSSDGVNFTYPNTPIWVAPVYKTVPVYGWVTTSTLNKGVSPTCFGGEWWPIPYDTSYNGPTNEADQWLWPGAIKISNPPVSGSIPSSWTNLGQLASSVTPGTYSQTKGQPNIQMVGVPFPYGMAGQTYIGQPIVKTLTVTTVDPSTGVQFNVTLVGTVGLTGVKWDWGDPGAKTTAPGDQSMYFGAQGLGLCSPAPFCGPTHTPTHIGNGRINVWEYYGSDIWEFYYDPVQGGVVSKDLGSGTSGYLGCPSDPNPSSRPGGSSFCLTPTPNPAQGGLPQALVGGVQVGGLPYSVGQVEGIPNS